MDALLCEHEGKDVAPLRRLAAGLSPTPDVLARLITIARLEHPPCAINATWVLKHLFDHAYRAGEAERDAILALLEDVEETMAQLHLLQILPYLRIPASATERLFVRVVELSGSPNTFVRAWAFNGLAYLADQHPNYHAAVEQRLGDAMTSEKASVRARIRHAIDGRFRAKVR